ncbi:MAG TPA: hypothetical protein VFE04_12780 [Puia sp.]|nr:hypothetical protein [Puia sp.]
MKYPIILLAIAIASCNKSALLPQHYQTIHQKWIVQEGHDQAGWNAAQFCNPSDFGKIDTVDLYFNNEPDNPNKFGYTAGSIYFHIPGGRIPTEIPDIYNRYYCKLLVKAE